MNAYEDIIKLDRPKSNYPKMSMESRATQFHPFAALTGHEEAIEETARFVEKKYALDEETKRKLDYALAFIKENRETKPFLFIEYYEADKKKEGGTYKQISGNLKKIDFTLRYLELESRQKIAFECLVSVSFDTPVQ